MYVCVCVSVANGFVSGRNRKGEVVCLGDHEVSRNTLPGSVEGSLSLVLSAHRDGNCEVTSPGCLEADEVTVLLTGSPALGNGD